MAIGRGIRAIATNGLSSFGATSVDTLVRAVYFATITRLLGPEGYGLWTFATTLYTLFLIAVLLGLETVVPYAYGQDREEGDRQAGIAAGIRLLAVGAGAIALFLWSLAVLDGEQRIATLLVVPALVFRGTALLNRAIFTGRMEVHRSVPAIVLGRVVELALGVTLIVAGYGLVALLLLHGAAWALETALTWRLLKRDSEVRLRLPTRDTARPILARGMPIAFLDLCNAFMMSAVILLYEPFARDIAELGQIGVAAQLASFALAGALAFLGTAVPVLRRSYDAGDPRTARYGIYVALIVMAGTAATLLLYEPVSRPVFALVLGDSYEEARQLTFYTLLTAGVVLLPHGFQQMLLLENRSKAIMLANALACLFVAVAFAVLGPSLDPLGAVVVALFGWSIRAALILAVGLSYANELSRRLA